MKKIVLVLAILLTALFSSGQAKWYLSQTCCAVGNQPWGSASNINAMNTAFGAGTWNQGQYSTVNVNALLQPSVCLIFMEGGSLDANALNNFLITNLPAIQNWVNNGGRLLINAAPNQGGNINYGFGGVLLNYAPGPWAPNANNAPGQAGHPIFNGPFLPAGLAYTGNWWCHGYVTGPGITQLVVEPGQPGCSLAEKNWGAGKAMFGSMTTSNWHLPQPNANNFIANVLRYLYVCCTQPTINVIAFPPSTCSGGTIQLTATGAGIGGTYTMTPPAPGFSVAGPVHTFTPPASGVYTVTGTSTTGCVGTTTIALQVNPTPSPTPSNNGPLCQGSPLNLNMNAIVGGTPAYTWNGPNGFIANTQNATIPNAQLVNAGIYTITVVNSFTDGTVCQAVSATTVNIVPVNQVTVTPNFTLCQGSNLNLTAQNTTPPTGYVWTGPNGFASALQNPTITNVTPINAGNYTVVASFTTPGIPLTCTSTAVSNLAVVATSPITLNIPSEVCQGSNVTISANAINNPTYTWTGPNNYVSNNQTNTFSGIQPSQAGSYSVTAMWSLGTVSCTLNNYGNINVVAVNPITITPPVNVCYPSDVSLQASSPGAISYVWSGPNGFGSGLMNLNFSHPNPNINGIYTVTTGYTDGILLCTNTVTTSVTVNPILTFTLPPYKHLCYDEVYIMNGPAGATSYTWNGPNGFVDNNQNAQMPINQAGSYTLTVNLGPCQTVGTTSVDVTTPIQFSLVPQNRTICKGDTVNLKVLSIGGSGNYAYNWNPSNYLSTPYGSVQIAQPNGTTIYNLTAYDITCPNYTINTQFAINVNSAPSPSLELDNNKCEPFCTIFNSKTGNKSNFVLYDFGQKQIQGDSVNICLDAGVYNIKIKTMGNNGCKETFNWGNLTVNHKPNGDFTWDPKPATTVINDKVTFIPTSKYGNTVLYNWFFLNDKTSFNTANPRPVVEYEMPGKYPATMIATNEWGCKDTITKVIEVDEDFSIYIPNAFTPNGIEPNEQFFPVTQGVEKYTMDIFNRWGELLHHSVNGKWDGTYKGELCKTEVYIYKIVALKKDKTVKEYVGHVSLLK